MTDRQELIERIEALDGPCREVDLAIAKLVGEVPQETVSGGVTGHMHMSNGQPACCVVPRYTASLDAAMTLGDDATMAQAMREAFSILQVMFWPKGDFAGALARYTVAAALRTRED